MSVARLGEHMQALQKARGKVSPCRIRRSSPGRFFLAQPLGKCWMARSWSVRKTRTFMPLRLRLLDIVVDPSCVHGTVPCSGPIFKTAGCSGHVWRSESDRILALAGIERSRRQRSVRLMEMLYTGESCGARPAQIKQGRYHLSAALFRYGTLTVFNSWGSSGRPLLQGSGECGGASGRK